MCRPLALREGATLHCGCWESREGARGGPTTTARASAWASQAGSRPGQSGEAGGRRSRVRSLCGGQAPLKPPCPGCGPLEAALPWLGPALPWTWPSRQPFLQNLPRPLFSLASGDIAWPGIQDSSPGAPGSRCPGQMGLLLAGQPHSQTPTPHMAWGTEPHAG